jgi:predicted DNA-binding transcriptional regulator YafY
MADPTSRALELLSLLQTHRHWRGEELALRLAVSERTLRRDVDRLRALGYPVDAPTGPEGGYRLGAGAQIPPLLIDHEEAVALAVALRLLAQTPIEGIEDTSARLMSKLEHVLPDRLRRRAEAAFGHVSVVGWTGERPLVAAATLTVVAEGCQDHVEIGFDYSSAGGEQTRRIAQPHRLVTVGQRWYLLAWDVRRDDWRTFRVDRMSEARVLGARFTPREPPGGDAAAFVASRLRPQTTTFRATVLVEHESEPGDATELVLEEASATWLATRVLMLAMEGAVTVIEADAEVRSALQAASQLSFRPD